jgi:hypothetical protein
LLERQFETENISPVKLSHLKKLYDLGRRDDAINLLRRRTTIKLDDNSIIQNNHHKLMWECRRFFLDYLLLVPNRLGLDTIIPNEENDLGYTFQMQLSDHHREFSYRYAQIGFDPKARMLFIGFQERDKVWLAMAPREALEHNAPHVAAGTCSGSTRMHKHHIRALIMWIAGICTSLDMNVWIREPYPDITLPDFKFETYTNLL